MTHEPEYREALISGHLDGELSPEQEAEFEAMLDESPAYRREFEAMKRLMTGTEAACTLSEPPEEIWDRFLDSIYNRLERRTGWFVVITGLSGLSLYALFLFFSEPWTSTPVKVLLAIPSCGLALLFVSVLRQRLINARTDRYTREIHR